MLSFRPANVESLTGKWPERACRLPKILTPSRAQYLTADVGAQLVFGLLDGITVQVSSWSQPTPTMTYRLERGSSRAPRESSFALKAGCPLDLGVPSSDQAAGDRRGEGEPELDRRSAPSHPQVLCGLASRTPNGHRIRMRRLRGAAPRSGGDSISTRAEKDHLPSVIEQL